MKIFRDTLQKGGKWDKQALTMFASFCMTCAIGGYIVVSDWFLEREINRYAIEAFYGFVLLSGGTGVINIWNKKVDRKTHHYSQYSQNHPYNEDTNEFGDSQSR